MCTNSDLDLCKYFNKSSIESGSKAMQKAIDLEQ